MIRLLLRVLGREGSKPLRRALVLMAVAAVAEGLAYGLLLPILRALFAGHTGEAAPWLAAFAGAVAITTVLRYRSDVSGFTTGGALSRTLHHRLGDHLARLPIGWFTPARVGEVAMLSARSVLQVMAVPAHQLQPLASSVLTPTTVAVVMLIADRRIGLAGLLAAPLLALVYRWTGALTKRLDAERSARATEAANRVVEFVRAQPVLRTGGRTAEGFGLLDEALDAQRAAGRRAAVAAVPGVLALAFTVQLAFTAILALAVFLLLRGSIGVAEALALLVLTARCVDPLLSLSELGGQLRASREELVRIDAVLGARPLPEPDQPATAVGTEIQFADVTVARGGRNVLAGLSMTVPAGATVAIVGPSGAGKSTLLHLVARFFDADSGAVRVGGVDVRELGTDRLMTMVSMVFQDVYLFAGTIEDNVRMGRPDASVHELAEAARTARLDEVIERLPDGWATPVGEGGVALSGGERQRVSIARALLKDAPILLLDEATSALDAANEAAVTDGLNRLREGRTVLMVTHRLRTAEQADQIMFLTAGTIAESGTHTELLRSGTHYPRFWNAFAELEGELLVASRE